MLLFIGSWLFSAFGHRDGHTTALTGTMERYINCARLRGTLNQTSLEHPTHRNIATFDSSSTMSANSFVPIPLDRSIPFAGMVDFHAKHNPTRPYAILAPTSDAGGSTSNVSWLEFSRATHRAAHLINPIVNGRQQIPAGKVIGIFALTDSIVYQAIVMGIVRSGNIVSALLFIAFKLFYLWGLFSLSQCRIAILRRL